jgi:hypothetical protein
MGEDKVRRGARGVHGDTKIHGIIAAVVRNGARVDKGG